MTASTLIAWAKCLEIQFGVLIDSTYGLIDSTYGLISVRKLANFIYVLEHFLPRKFKLNVREL